MASDLDHPIWTALTGEQKALAQGNGFALRYPAEIAPFAAMREPTPQAFEALRELIPERGSAILFTVDEIAPPPGLKVQLAGAGYQMIAGGDPAAAAYAQTPEITTLHASDVPEMVRLTELTKPGPFSARTHELGRYLGIRLGGRLAAMAGERMRMNGYVEISAVCVHPDHRGKGYARILVRTLMESLRQQGLVPMLHVFEGNASAIALYQQLGFEIRRRLHVTGLRRA